MGISEKGYYNGLSISVGNYFQMHLKQLPNSCFVKNYFRTGLLAWEANLDKQPFFKHNKAVTYIWAYLSKTEDECSHAMNQTFNEAITSNLTNYDQVKSIARAYEERM